MKSRYLALAAVLGIGSILHPPAAQAAGCHPPGGMNLQQWYQVCGPSLQQTYAAGAAQGQPYQNFVLAMYRIYLRPPMPMTAPAMGGAAGMMCPIGAVQCFSGYVRTCERMPTGGSWWITSARQCR